MIVYVLVGLQLSGKSSHGNKLMKESGIPMIETGHAVYMTLQEKNLQANHKNTSKVIKGLLSENPLYFAKKILKLEKKRYVNSDKLVFNGIKSPAEIEYVENKFGKKNVIVIAFHARQKTRFSRVNNIDRFVISSFNEKKQEDKDLGQWKNFIERDQREIDLGIGMTIARANYAIVTEDKYWPYNGFDISYQIFREIVLNKKRHNKNRFSGESKSFVR